ncbi:uncharacterized protein LOC122369832, partial [Amphibalanus amphitrite]
MRMKLCWLVLSFAVCGDLVSGQPQGNSSSVSATDVADRHRSRRDAGSCFYNGEMYRCFFSITCIFSGGKLMPGCGSLLYSCCVPESTKRHSGTRHDRGFRFPSLPLTVPRLPPPRLVFRRPPPQQRGF